MIMNSAGCCSAHTTVNKEYKLNKIHQMTVVSGRLNLSSKAPLMHKRTIVRIARYFVAFAAAPAIEGSKTVSNGSKNA